jgi:tetratricopeptide (TPR) repeat protein
LNLAPRPPVFSTKNPFRYLASLRISQSRYKDALALVEEELAHHPEDLAAILAKGQLLLHFGRASEALPLLTKAFHFKTTSPLVDKRLVADMLLRANVAVGNNRDALELGLQMLAATDTAEAVNMRTIKQRLHRLVKSVPPAELLHVEEVVERECTNPRQVATLRFGLGDVLDRADRTAEAKVMFRKGLELMPMAARGHYRLGFRLIQEGDYANGYIHSQQAFHIDPTDRAIVNEFFRVTERLNNKKRDLAWTLKDWMRGSSTDVVMEQPLLFAPLF